MPKFFVRPNQIENGFINIIGDDAHHISRSLRMAAGERITVSDMNNNEYECVLEEFTEGSVRARIVESYSSNTESDVSIHLYQALPKGEKLDFIIQKAVECGVYDITPFESERCVVKIKSDSESRKNERRNKISLEAAKQCGRGMVPYVFPTTSFQKMLQEASSSDAVLFCYEGKGTSSIGKVLRQIKKEKSIKDIAVIIGSEGGFSDYEAEAAKERGFSMIGLGKRILRAETASIFALAAIVYEFELI